MEPIQLQDELHKGDYTTVYNALQGGERVIVKILNEQFPSLKQIARFNEELDITNRFDIEGSRKVLSKQKINDRHALVLEYVDGGTLKEHIKSLKENEQVISISDFLEIATSITHILAQVHENQIIHKDINPKNIILKEGNECHLIDFGIANILKKQAQKQSPDTIESLEGTLAYISPEQTGRMNRSIDHRSDLYSLGATFYELLVGHPPFPEEDDTMEMIHFHLAKAPALVSQVRVDIPTTISNIINKLLAKTPEERYQSTYGLHHDLSKCLTQWQKNEQIEDFELGEADFLDSFKIPEKLYGRETEREVLLNLFDEVAQGGLEMMLIGGFSGIGKTALVNEIHKPVTAKKGSFISGKFEQYQKDTPYSAVIDAITDFTNQLLAKPEKQINFWKKLIIDAVGTNGQVLLDVIPNLELLLGKQPPVPELGPTETQNRFRSVFQSFIRAVSTPQHPLVIFLDDWQWADSGSIEVLKALMADTENKYLLLICAYRSNEVTKAHPFTLSLDEIRKNGKEPRKIKLEALDLATINQLVSDTLHVQEEKTKALAQLLSDKTEGNPFFMTQLFGSLYENGQITYNHDEKIWKWDIDQIDNMDVTGNVVELMVDKIRKLEDKTQQIMQTASCIGNKFSLTILASLAGKSQKNVLDDLWQAIDEGMVVTTSGNPYSIEETTVDSDVYLKFFHDRVEQAAYSLVSDEIKKRNRLTIGRGIITEQSAEYIEEFLFDVVNYLNAGRELMTEKDELIRLAELNIRAGKKAKKAAAYKSAIEFFEVADKVLGESKWVSHYDLVIDLYADWGETLFLIPIPKTLNTEGDLVDDTSLRQKSDEVLNIGLERAQNKLDKTKFYTIQITLDSVAHKYAEATLKVIEVAKLFDIHLPDINDGDAIAKGTEEELAIYHKYMETHDIHSFATLPDIANEENRVLVDIMCRAVADVFIGLPNYFVYYMTKIMNTAAKYGLSQYVSPGYAFFSIVLCAFRNYTDAYHIANIAYNLVEEGRAHPSDIGPALQLKSYMDVLRKPYYESTVDGFATTYQRAIQVGDLVYGGFSLATRDRHFIITNLDDAWEEAIKTKRFLNDIGNAGLALYNSHIYGVVRNLKGETSGLDVFTCEEFDEPTFLGALEQGAAVLAGLYKRFKMQIFVLYELYDKVYKYIEERGTWLVAGEAIDLAYKADYNLYMVLAITRSYDTLSPEKKEEYDAVMETSMAEIKVLAEDHSPENFGAYYELMKGEKARIDGEDLMVVAGYFMKAVKYAQDARYLSLEGLANEYLAQIYIDLDTDIARMYMQRAKYTYNIWGATRKEQLLEEKYPQLFSRVIEHSATVHSGTIHDFTRGTSKDTSTVKAAGLEFQTVLKASQAISGEVKLEALLDKMLNIAMENAGASRAVILRPESGEHFTVLAENIADENEKHETAEDLKAHLPITLIRYVARMKHHVVLDDARKDKMYGNDSYVVNNQVKSVLCIPVISKDKVSALIYLENNLVDHAFTESRVSTLKLLMGQMAVSFENAQLYNNMEQEIAKQTEEIRSQGDRITASIRYAQTIQNAILPPESFLNELYAEHFAFYVPKDIVSGDFYWARLSGKYIYTAAVDCTGHGVPGAFMSMISKTLLDEIVTEKGITEPASILLELHNSVKRSLRQDDTDNDDGMDLSMVRVEYKENNEVEVLFSGAKRPIYAVSSGELLEFKADRKSIGGVSKSERNFTNQVISLKSGDVLYLYSDGLTDVASPERKMFGKKKLRSLLESYVNTPLSQQDTLLREAVKAHQRTAEQRDDISFLGLKLK